MATDPNQLLGVLLGTVGQQGNILAQAQQNAQQGQLADQQLALGQQQQQLNNQQIASQQRDADQQAQYGQDVSRWIAGGSDGAGLTNLIARYPKQWQALQQSWKIRGQDQAQADLRSFGSVFNALDNNAPDVALKELKARRDAEKARGLATDELDQHIGEIESGNPQAIAAVKGFARAQIAAAAGAAGDTGLAKSVGVDVDADRYKAISGKGVFDTRTGTYVEGGDQASTDGGAVDGSGGPAAGRRTMGWTPSTADGGDNAPSVVRAKIGDIVKRTGFDPSKPLTLDQVRSLSGPIAATEGGPGSLADKNNNPGNIQDGKFARSQPGYAGKGVGGRYAMFDTKEHGDQAAQALLAHYYARGQRSINDIIMGKPSGSSATATTNAPAQAALVRQYGKAPTAFRWKPDGSLEPIPGGPKDDTGKTGSGLSDDAATMIADQYLAGDKSALQNIGRGAQGAADLRKVRNLVAQRAKSQGLSGKQVAAQMADFAGSMAAERATGTRMANVELPAAEAQKLFPLALQASAALPRSGFLPFSKAEQSVRNGLNDPRYRQFVAANNALVNVYSRAVSPTGTPTVADKEHARQLLDTAYDQKSYSAVVAQMQREIGAARQAPAQVRQELRSSIGGAQPSRPAPAGFRILSVRRK